MRLPNIEQAARAWVIEQIAPAIRLLDVWELPVVGGRDEFARSFEVLSKTELAGSRVSRALFWIRFRLGSLLHWDDPAKARPIPGNTETSLRARPSDELRSSVDGIPAVVRAFAPLCLTGDEFAAEISNEPVHGVLQFT